MKIPYTPSQVLNPSYHVTNIPSQCRRHQVLQPKQRVRQPKQQIRPILINTFLWRGKFLSQIYALFWRTIYRPKNAVAYKKWQIWGMSGSLNSKLKHPNTKFWTTNKVNAKRSERVFGSCLLIRNTLFVSKRKTTLFQFGGAGATGCANS